MDFLKHTFSRKTLFRSLLVFVGIAIVYLVICLGLIFLPSPPPFANTPVNHTELKTQAFEKNNNHTTEIAVEEINILARDGKSIFAHRFGSDTSTSIIFMHGVASTGAAMEKGARLLHETTGAEVITPDFRGHGQSDGKPFDVEYIGQYEDDLEDIINYIKRERPTNRFIIAGHSMGGGVAMRYALKEDAPVPYAYLLLAPNFGEGPTQRSDKDVDEKKAKDASSFVHFDVRRMIGIILLNSVGIHDFDYLPILYFNNPLKVMEYTYRAVMSAQPIRPKTSDIALQSVKSPLLVIVGSDDEVFEVANFESYVSENSHGKTVIIPGLTHESVFNDMSTYKIIAEWYNKLP
jgi:pimeloyl-ACP methyl ester carboxylesterase